MRGLAKGGVPLARILIFDSSLLGGGSGGENPYDQSPLGDVNDIKRTAPVRLFTHEGHIPDVSFEFLMVNYGATLAIRWYQEFYTDHPKMGYDGASAKETSGLVYDRAQQRPNFRDFPGATNDITWAREQTAVVNNDGTIDHFDALRRMTMTDNQARYFPMLVHSLWMRLAIYAVVAPAVTPQLRVWANVGGIAESAYLREQTIPYDYGEQIT